MDFNRKSKPVPPPLPPRQQNNSSPQSSSRPFSSHQYNFGPKKSPDSFSPAKPWLPSPQFLQKTESLSIHPHFDQKTDATQRLTGPRPMTDPPLKSPIGPGGFLVKPPITSPTRPDINQEPKPNFTLFMPMPMPQLPQPYQSNNMYSFRPPGHISPSGGFMQQPQLPERPWTTPPNSNSGTHPVSKPSSISSQNETKGCTSQGHTPPSSQSSHDKPQSLVESVVSDSSNTEEHKPYTLPASNTNKGKGYSRPQPSSRYSFQQHVNQIPPSYKLANVNTGPITMSTEPEELSDVAPKTPMRSSATPSPTNIDEYEDLLGLEAINTSLLSPQAKLLHHFAKREFRFTRSLGAIEKLVIRKIQGSPLFSEDVKEVTEAILSNLPTLLAAHRQFVGELALKIKGEINEKKPIFSGEVFLRRMDGFIKFVEFSRNLPQIETYLLKAKENSPKFQSWFQELETHSVFNGNTFLEYLYAVRSHLDPYPVIIQEVRDASADSKSQDCMILETVIFAFKELLEDLDSLNLDTSLKGNISFSLESPATEKAGEINLEADNWASAVTPSILEGLSEQEIKRQEAIFELLQSERDYLGDLKCIQTLFVGAIRNSSNFTSKEQAVMIHKLFFNYMDIVQLHEPVVAQLTKRQNDQIKVENIGDLLKPWSEGLSPYKIYGARVQFAAEYCTRERIDNPKFAQMLKECEQDKMARRLPMDSFISMPTRRLARYPLYFKEILKRTPKDHPDEEALNFVLVELEKHLSLINQAKGETDSKLRLRAVADRLELHPMHHGDSALNLDHPDRRLVKEGYLKLVKGSVLLRVFLFDHYILLAKERELEEDLFEYESYRKPFLLSEISVDEQLSLKTIQSNMSSGFFESVFSGGSSNPPNPSLCFSVVNSNSKDIWILCASIQTEKEGWVTAINNEKKVFSSNNI